MQWVCRRGSVAAHNGFLIVVGNLGMNSRCRLGLPEGKSVSNLKSPMAQVSTVSATARQLDGPRRWSQLYAHLAHRQRSPRTNRLLGGLLAFVAGAINAGGFLAVQRYTSHMTGVVSAIADDLVLGHMALVVTGVASLGFFVAGAAATALMINWARRRGLHSEFAFPVLVEAGLLLVFGVLGANLDRLIELFAPTTVLLLCFIMGLQNAVITKLSQAEIRTTHMTGVITDVGIELGRLMYWNQFEHASLPPVRANRERLRVLLAILGLFFLGGLVGALAFKWVGYIAVLPFSALLLLLALPPLVADVKAVWLRWWP